MNSLEELNYINFNQDQSIILTVAPLISVFRLFRLRNEQRIQGI